MCLWCFSKQVLPRDPKRQIWDSRMSTHVKCICACLSSTLYQTSFTFVVCLSCLFTHSLYMHGQARRSAGPQSFWSWPIAEACDFVSSRPTLRRPVARCLGLWGNEGWGRLRVRLHRAAACGRHRCCRARPWEDCVCRLGCLGVQLRLRARTEHFQL